MRKIILAVAAITLFIGNTIAQNETTTELKNDFVVTSEDCKKWGLPPIEFSLKYPKDIRIVLPKESVKNENYIHFLAKEGTIDFEELKIGWVQVNPRSDYMGMNLQLLSQIEASILAADADAQTLIKGKGQFLNYSDVYQLKMKYSVAGIGNNAISYKIMAILLPDDNKPGAGVLLIFHTYDSNKHIKEFYDFGKKGITGEIWKSFSFTE